MGSAKEGLFYPDGSFRSIEEINSQLDAALYSGEPEQMRAAVLDILDYKTITDPTEIADKLDVGLEVVSHVIDDLIEDGYGVVASDKGFLKTKNVDPETPSHDDSDLGRHLHIGVVSDSHMASKKERLDELEAMYDIFEREGVGVVYHVGDITEGWGVYRGQEFEVKLPGQDEQIDYAVANYPRRDGIRTKFITGNHDLRQYERGGVDPGRPIARRRDDLDYLGPMTATVKFYDGVTMELLHPGGGVAYALSYKAQKDINNRHPEDLPHALVFGHYHTSFYMYYRNIHFLQAPCFKGAGLWEKRLGLNPTIGGWLVDATIDGGRFARFKPELFTFRNTPA